MGSYWKQIIARAARETRQELFLSGERAVIAIFVAAIYLAVIWLVVPEGTAWDASVDRAALSIAPLLAFPLIYLWKLLKTPADVFQEQEARYNTLENSVLALSGRIADLERSRPELEGIADSVLWLPNVEEFPSMACCIVNMTIFNKGTIASVAHDFGMFLNLDDSTIETILYHKPKFHLVINKELEAIISEDDFIYKKALTPIPVGGMIQGVMIGYFSKSTVLAMPKSIKVQVTYLDFRGTKYSADYVDPGGVDPKGIRYYPGMNIAFQGISESDKRK